jgi:hypothetical protein
VKQLPSLKRYNIQFCIKVCGIHKIFMCAFSDVAVLQLESSNYYVKYELQSSKIGIVLHAFRDIV